MSERWRSSSSIPNQNAIVRRQTGVKAEIAYIAARQWGRIRWDQLLSVGLAKAQISDWVAQGYLHPVHPRVYAVGHRTAGTEADLVSALFYAGPGAMLSHDTATWWWGLSDREPKVLDVTTPRRCRSLPRRGSQRAVRVHGRRRIERVWHRRLPLTTVSQTLLDYASVASFDRVRYALAQADYHRLLDIRKLERTLGRGCPGTVRLRRALENHLPELAYTRSEFERRFIALCEAGGLPMPKFNVKVCGLRVDAVWRDQRVVVELDGEGNHGRAAQIARDHGRDLRLRAAGFVVLRYSWEQLTRRHALVLADLRRALGLPRAANR